MCRNFYESLLQTYKKQRVHNRPDRIYSVAEVSIPMSKQKYGMRNDVLSVIFKFILFTILLYIVYSHFDIGAMNYIF